MKKIAAALTSLVLLVLSGCAGSGAFPNNPPGPAVESSRSPSSSQTTPESRSNDQTLLPPSGTQPRTESRSDDQTPRPPATTQARTESRSGEDSSRTPQATQSRRGSRQEQEEEDDDSRETSRTPLSPTPGAAPGSPLLSNSQALPAPPGWQRTDYAVFAWNDLGMHCANPTYDQAVLLPPYNTVWAQVVKRGNPPQVVTSGLTVQYRFLNNTYSYGKASFGQFWDNMQKLFGATLERNTGLNLTDPNIHNGLAGTMVVKGDHFEADGIPLTPIDDSNVWNPFQVCQITVTDSTGKVIGQTYATAPVSDEINCAKCHGSNAFLDILQKHDARNGTNLVSRQPVLCAGCHGDPALGAPKSGQVSYLSDAMHSFHATVNPQPTCYDCHPGPKAQCSRSLAHISPDGNCTTCHGSLQQVGGSIDSGARMPWVNEPKCVTCHQGVAEVDTQNTLFRNATGHGGVYCASCHQSPHAWVPTSLPSDNYQALQYQGKAMSIGDCRNCHRTSRGGGSASEFAGKHGGTNTREPTACNVCHTGESNNVSKWPHAFQWKTR